MALELTQETSVAESLGRGDLTSLNRHPACCDELTISPELQGFCSLVIEGLGILFTEGLE